DLDLLTAILMSSLASTPFRTTPPAALLTSFLTDTASRGSYTLSLHDALPISGNLCSFHHPERERVDRHSESEARAVGCLLLRQLDRKSTRLNSSHVKISYAVFCLKKKRPALTALEQRVARLENGVRHRIDTVG